MSLMNQCLWEESVTADTYSSLENSNNSVDVCIIGGGYTGLSTGIHLAEKDISTCILEANNIGHGGSGRNVGYINAGVWMKPNDVENVLGQKSGSKLNRMLGDAPKQVFQLIDRYNIDAQETRTGNLQLAHNAKTEADIRERHRQWLERDANVELIEKPECYDVVGTDKICLALKCNRSGTLNPYAYAMGLAKAATSIGVKIYENSPVVEMRQVNEEGVTKWQVTTKNGSIVFANKVVLSTNAYTEGEFTDIKKTMFMVNYYQIASEPLTSNSSKKILPDKQGAADARTVLSSIRRDKDDRLLLGTVGSHIGKPSSFMPAWADRVASYYFPELGKLNWQYQWSGQFGFTNDHLMRIYEPAPNLITSTAFNGRGITTGTLFGKCFANYIVSNNPDDLPLPINKIENHLQKFRYAKSMLYETGVTLYHAGQCLRVII